MNGRQAVKIVEQIKKCTNKYSSLEHSIRAHDSQTINNITLYVADTIESRTFSTLIEIDKFANKNFIDYKSIFKVNK